MRTSSHRRQEHQSKALSLIVLQEHWFISGLAYHMKLMTFTLILGSDIFNPCESRMSGHTLRRTLTCYLSCICRWATERRNIVFHPVRSYNSDTNTEKYRPNTSVKINALVILVVLCIAVCFYIHEVVSIFLYRACLRILYAEWRRVLRVIRSWFRIFFSIRRAGMPQLPSRDWASSLA